MMKLALPFLFLCLVAATTASGSSLQVCPQYWLLYRNKCYRYYGGRLTWADADKFCGSIFSANGRAHLAVIHSDDENAFLYDMFHSYAGEVPQQDYSGPHFGAWLGMKRDAQDNLSVWVDGTPIDYTSWLSGQPDNNRNNEGCVHFWRRYDANDMYDVYKGWNDNPCDRTMPFICELEPDVLHL